MVTAAQVRVHVLAMHAEWAATGGQTETERFTHLARRCLAGGR